MSTRRWTESALAHALAGGRVFSELDRALAALICRLAGEQSSPELLLAALLVSSQTAAQHACADLALFAGEPVDAELADGPVYPRLDFWLARLQECEAVIGNPNQADRPLILAGSRLYLARYWQYEAHLAQWLLQRLHQPEITLPAALNERLEQLFRRDQHTQGLTDWQRTAVVNALASRFCVISGGPGTGKTTTVAKLLVLLLEAQPDLRIALAAPTGKAAARLKEALKRSSAGMEFLDPLLRQQLLDLPATTLHRLLGARWGSTRFRHDKDNLLPYDLILVDEASMIDLALMVKLLEAVPEQARLVLLGDKDQLASVEAGSVLGDLCSLARGEAFSAPRRQLLQTWAPGDYIPADGLLDDHVVLLKHSWRFAAGGGIGRLASAMQAGDAQQALDILTQPDEDVRWRPLPPPARREAVLGQSVIDAYAPLLTAASPGEALAGWERFMVLAAMRNGPYGVEELNRTIETLLLRAGLIRGGDWYHRRPVLISANDQAQQLFNGDVGVVWHGPGGVRVWFQRPDGTLRDLVPARLGRHETAWAMTIHKSQGSEFDKILMLLPEDDSPLLTRELLYTGLTRARRQAEIWGPGPLLATAIGRRIQRSSGLAELLQEKSK